MQNSVCTYILYLIIKTVKIYLTCESKGDFAFFLEAGVYIMLEAGVSKTGSNFPVMADHKACTYIHIDKYVYITCTLYNAYGNYYIECFNK